ncbi:MAG: hypothetical protein NZ937_03120 [Armatimonadetes bacterium]|nr:hypothetical protein [Armatimonadota bacterium]
MPAVKGLQFIGWMGLTFFVPENWDLVHSKGNRFDGYLRFEEDGVIRCEIQWTLVSAGKVILDEQVEHYLKSLEQMLRKQGKPVTVRKNIHIVSRKQVKRNVRDFMWQSSTIGYGMMWFCEDCRRALVAQVVGYEHEPVKEWAKQVFLSLSDHSDGDWETWSVYGLKFEAPKGWNMSKGEIMPGKICFNFKLGEYEMTVSRYGPASVLLKDKKLEEFAIEVLGKETVERFKIHYRTENLNGHEGIELIGKDKRAKSPLHVFLRRLKTGNPFPQFRGRLWNCEQSNRIYLAVGLIAPEHEPLWEQFANSVSCHEKEF